MIFCSWYYHKIKNKTWKKTVWNRHDYVPLSSFIGSFAGDGTADHKGGDGFCMQRLYAVSIVRTHAQRYML